MVIVRRRWTRVTRSYRGEVWEQVIVYGKGRAHA